MAIFLWILVVIGLFEITSNLFHLSRNGKTEIGKSGKRQHQELPIDLNEFHYFVKVIIMLIFGILFLASSIVSLIDFNFGLYFLWIVVIGFGGYGILQAVIYRREFKVWPAMLVYNLPLLALLFLTRNLVSSSV